MNYDVDHFIRKFEATEDRQWCIESFSRSSGRCCALGHCGMDVINGHPEETEESEALMEIFAKSRLSVASVNDGHERKYPQPTPRARILAALRDVKQQGKE